MDKRWHYLLEYIGALLCAFLANMEYSFSYMNGIHLFLWIIYFCMFLYFRETILYCFIHFFMIFAIFISWIIGITTNPQIVPMIFDVIMMIVLLVLVVVMLIKRKHLHQKQNDFLINEFKDTLLSGNGTAQYPYILDEKKLSSSWQQMVDEYHHQVIYALNGAGQEYKDEHFGITDCILAGKKHQQEYLGGYWTYQSDRPTIQKLGTLWFQTVIYVSYENCQIIYELLQDHQKWQTIQKLSSSLSKASYHHAMQILKEHEISKKHSQVLLKVIGIQDHFLDSEIILKLLKYHFQLTHYQEAVEYQCGMMYCIYCMSYQGQWFQWILEENWNLYPILYEPSIYYGKGIYQPFQKDFV